MKSYPVFQSINTVTIGIYEGMIFLQTSQKNIASVGADVQEKASSWYDSARSLIAEKTGF